MSISTTNGSDAESALSSSATLSPGSEPIAIPTSPWTQGTPLSFGSDVSYEDRAEGLAEPCLLPPLSPTPLSGIAYEEDRRFLTSPRNRPRQPYEATGSPRYIVPSTYQLSLSPNSPRGLSSDMRRASTQFLPPNSPPQSHLTPSPNSRRRRRSSASLSTSAGSAPFGSFVGSFEQSLLSGRLSALPSLPLPFVLSIGVLGGEDAPMRLKCPPHISLPFGAFFYSTAVETDSNKNGSPYVGTVDLEAHYLSMLSSPSTAQAGPPPRFPGYQLPIRGQLQLVLKNPNATAIKLFLVPYDLSGLNRGAHGGKTFLRQKSYTVDPDGRERLRYAVHLHFCSPPITPSSSSSVKRAEPKYYLHNNVRLVFASRGLDSTDKLKVVAEGPQGVMTEQSSNFSLDDSRFAPYNGPGVEWEMARRKIKEREKIRGLPRVQTSTEPNTEVEASVSATGSFVDSERAIQSDLVSHAIMAGSHDPNGLDLEDSRPPSPANGHSPGHTPPPHLPSSAPLQPSASPRPFDMSKLARALAPTPLPLSFERPASPAQLSQLKGRPPLRSGLSVSRPPSRVQSDRLSKDPGE